MDLDKITIYAGAFATVFTIVLILCQNDRTSRYILSPGRLRAKRRQEQLYLIEKAIATAVLFIRKYVNDGSFYDWQEERKITDLIIADEQVKNLVDAIVITNRSSSSVIVDKEGDAASKDDKDDDDDEDDRVPEETPFIIGIAKDLNLAKADEWYIHLAFPFQVENGTTTNEKKTYYGRRVQVPLEKFGKYLAAAFEKEPKESSLCFIADASSSLGSNIIGQVVQHSQCQIPVVHEPAWMYMLAFLIQRKAYPKEVLEKVFYGLCRLNAQALQHKIGDRYKTIVFTLPGQACTAALLPLLQHVFPRERHVFAYDGCIKSVERSLRLVEQNENHYVDKGKKKGIVIPTINSTNESSMPRSVSSSTPITPLSLEKLTFHLTSLSFNEASIVESWMSSVSTFLSLKNDEKNNGYVPFVCRVEFLLNNDGKNQPSTTSCNALKNLLEFISGSRSQPLERNEIDAAESMLVDLQNIDENSFGKELRTSTNEKRNSTIENCVMAHKGIFSSKDVSLPDTVQPSSDGWSLKSS